MKALIVIALLAILAALVGAGVLMLRRSKGRGSMANALALRVGLSVLLFLFILLSHWMGWIQPGGIPLGR